MTRSVDRSSRLEAFGPYEVQDVLWDVEPETGALAFPGWRVGVNDVQDALAPESA